MRAERFPTKENANLEIYGSSRVTLAQLKNISSTGACLEWDDNGFQLTQGDLVRMTIVLKSLNREHRVNAEVIWAEGKATGVQFLKPNELIDRMVGKTPVN